MTTTNKPTVKNHLHVAKNHLKSAEYLESLESGHAVAIGVIIFLPVKFILCAMYLDKYKELPETGNILEIAMALDLNASSDSILYKIQDSDDRFFDDKWPYAKQRESPVNVEDTINYLVSNMSESVKKEWDTL